MSRGRLIPSLNYRSFEVVDMGISNNILRNASTVEVYGASNLNDAFSNPRLMFEVPVGRTYISTTLEKCKV